MAQLVCTLEVPAAHLKPGSIVVAGGHARYLGSQSGRRPWQMHVVACKGPAANAGSVTPSQSWPTRVPKWRTAMRPTDTRSSWEDKPTHGTMPGDNVAHLTRYAKVLTVAVHVDGGVIVP